MPKRSTGETDAGKRAGMPERPRRAGGGTAEGTGGERQAPAARGRTTGAGTSMLMEEVLRRENLMAAYERVVRNAGAAGVDGMTVEELMPYCREHWADIRERLRSGSYVPQPVRKVEIPKPGGKGVRTLGIPTVLDRLIQQALLQVLTPIFDPTFSESSYGFRPGRSAHQAVLQAREHMTAGYRWVVDMDLEKFLVPSSDYPRADCGVSKSPGRASGTLMRRPLRRPRETCIASSSPRFTRCNTVWRETPRMRMASTIGTYPSGASSAKSLRSSSVTLMRQGAPGVTCSPAMMPSLRQRWRVAADTPRSRAASLTLTRSPCRGSAGGSKRGMLQ